MNIRTLLFSFRFWSITGAMLVLSTASCRRDPVNPPAAEVPAADTLSATTDSATVKKAQADGVYVTVEAKEGGILKNLELQVKDTTLPGLVRRQLQLDGEISNIHIADLNRDGKKEVYIFNTGSGSGSYGEVLSWQLEGSRLDSISMETGEAERDAGYMGHDSFYLQAPFLVRNYPVYHENDPNCCPTGGEKNIKYRLEGSSGQLSLRPVNE